MPKKNNREMVVLGHVTTPKAAPKTLEQLAAEVEASIDPTVRTVEEVGELYTGSADPGSIVGLDEFTPDSETAVDGDSTRTDPDPS